jgi:hypothetical protein
MLLDSPRLRTQRCNQPMTAASRKQREVSGFELNRRLPIGEEPAASVERLSIVDERSCSASLTISP